MIKSFEQTASCVCVCECVCVRMSLCDTSWLQRRQGLNKLELMRVLISLVALICISAANVAIISWQDYDFESSRRRGIKREFK